MDRKLAILMGIGLALIPIHRFGMVFSGLGLGLVLMAVVCIIVLRLKEHRLVLGSKYVYIPLIVIVLLALVDGNLVSRLLSVALFAVYVAGVNLKEELKVLGIAVAIGCISIVACNLLEGERTGGMYQAYNYNLAIGVIIMGTLMFKSRYHWILAAIVLLGLAFSGAEEALVALAVLGLALLVRRDWSKKVLLSVGMIVLAILVSVPFGLWTAPRVEALVQGNTDFVVVGRLDSWRLAVTSVELLGHGYEPFNVRYDSVHSVPLRILHELGPLAALAWVVVLVYLFVKTKRKYIPTTLLALGLFDHFLWTQLSMYTFVAIGIAARNDGISDLIFKRAIDENSSRNTLLQ